MSGRRGPSVRRFGAGLSGRLTVPLHDDNLMGAVKCNDINLNYEENGRYQPLLKACHLRVPEKEKVLLSFQGNDKPFEVSFDFFKNRNSKSDGGMNGKSMLYVSGRIGKENCSRNGCFGTLHSIGFDETSRRFFDPVPRRPLES